MDRTRSSCLWFGFVLLVASCTPAPLEPSPLGIVELTTAESSSTTPLPWLVLLHGRGGSPERFIERFRALPFAAHVIALRAPIAEQDGRAWFTFAQGVDGALSQLRALVPRVLLTLQTYASMHAVAGRPLLSGFSQGGMLCYELALRSPQVFAAVFPISAMKLGHGVERLPKDFPPLHAFHGSVDPVIQYEADADTIASLRRAGAAVELTRIDGAPHWITEAMRQQLFSALELAARAESANTDRWH